MMRVIRQGAEGLTGHGSGNGDFTGVVTPTPTWVAGLFCVIAQARRWW